MNALKFALFAIVGIAGVTALVAGLGALVMVLWNALLPALFGLPVVTFWQAAGLVVLAKIVGGLLFGHRRPPHPRMHPRPKGMHRHFHPFRCGKQAESSA